MVSLKSLYSAAVSALQLNSTVCIKNLPMSVTIKKQ